MGAFSKGYIYKYYDIIFLGYVLFYNADVCLFIGTDRLDEYIASESVVVVTVGCDTVLLYYNIRERNNNNSDVGVAVALFAVIVVP